MSGEHEGYDRGIKGKNRVAHEAASHRVELLLARTFEWLGALLKELEQRREGDKERERTCGHKEQVQKEVQAGACSRGDDAPSHVEAQLKEAQSDRDPPQLKCFVTGDTRPHLLRWWIGD
jgi:hypothetical protein